MGSQYSMLSQYETQKIENQIAKYLLKVICLVPEHCQKCKIKFFEKIINDWNLLTIFAKSSILHVWLGSKYAATVNSELLGGRLFLKQPLWSGFLDFVPVLLLDTFNWNLPAILRIVQNLLSSHF